MIYVLGGAFLALSVLDIVLTNRIISNGGNEMNPVMKFCMNKLGNGWWIPKMAASALIVLFLACINSTNSMIMVCLVQSAIVAWNIKEIYK